VPDQPFLLLILTYPMSHVFVHLPVLRGRATGQMHKNMRATKAKKNDAD
jgi:hypothetical protein